jgi:hypothetical protein
MDPAVSHAGARRQAHLSCRNDDTTAIEGEHGRNQQDVLTLANRRSMLSNRGRTQMILLGTDALRLTRTVNLGPQALGWRRRVSTSKTCRGKRDGELGR